MFHNKKKAAIALGILLALTGIAQAETTGQFIDDSTITTKVKAALVADSNLPAGDISVTTDKGVVKLTGNVDTSSQYALAAQDASTISGVRIVSNQLTVHASTSKM